MKRIIVVVTGFFTAALPAWAFFHDWDDAEIFSTADGLVQFVEFQVCCDGENFASGQQLVAINQANTKTNIYTFPNDLPGSTGGRRFIVATPGFQKLPGGIEPDYTIPSGFLFPSGSVDLPVAAALESYGAGVLPLNGTNSMITPSQTPAINSPSNISQRSGSVAIPSGGSGDVYFQGLYHNNPATNATEETIPHKDFLTNKFLEVGYDTTNVNFYFLTASPAGDGAVSTRIRLYALGPNANFEQFVGATFQANVVLEPTNQFHNTPDVSGPGAFTNTLDLWKATWIPPREFTGTVFYAPQVLINGGASDLLNLTRVTNNTPGPKVGANDFYWKTNAQAFGPDYFGVDYSFNWTNPVKANFDFIYHNHTSFGLPQDEDVPGVPGQKFFQYNYQSNLPSYVYMLAPPFGVASAQTRFYFIGGGGEQFRASQFYTNVEISAGGFHGLPASGVLTLSVWRTEFWPPGNWNMTPTNFLFYANQVVTPSDGTTWLLQDFDNNPGGVSVTNNMPQFFNANIPFDRDWGFLPTGPVKRASVKLDFLYHNNTNLNPQAESLPGVAREFLEVNYATTTTTFHILTDSPANLTPGESLFVQLRTIWSTNLFLNFTEQYSTMNFVQNIVLDAGNPFHGFSAGHTVDVWRLDWPQPTEGGIPVTNQFTVFYAPFLKTVLGSGQGSAEFETSYIYLIANPAGGFANGWPTDPQFLGPNYFGNDYAYNNQFNVNFDSDGDGLSNIQEGILGTNPNDADSDDDGQTDGEEVLAGTDPGSGNEYFHVTDSVQTGSVMRIEFAADTNLFYDVQFTLGPPTNNAFYSTLYTGITVAAPQDVITNLPIDNANKTYRILIRAQ